MNCQEKAIGIVDALLGYLGFVVHVESEKTNEGLSLQIYSKDSSYLTGKQGEELDDLQYIVNRLLRSNIPEAPKVRVDIEHYRSMQEEAFIHNIKLEAEKVRKTGLLVELPRMNSYQRRMVYNAFINDPEISAVSSKEDARFKPIKLIRRK